MFCSRESPVDRTGLARLAHPELVERRPRSRVPSAQRRPRAAACRAAGADTLDCPRRTRREAQAAGRTVRQARAGRRAGGDDTQRAAHGRQPTTSTSPASAARTARSSGSRSPTPAAGAALPGCGLRDARGREGRTRCSSRESPARRHPVRHRSSEAARLGAGANVADPKASGSGGNVARMMWSTRASSVRGRLGRHPRRLRRDRHTGRVPAAWTVPGARPRQGRRQPVLGSVRR